VSWSAQIWNEKGNNGFAITDVNKDGANDVLTVIAGNPAVLNGKDGSIMYHIDEIFSSNVTYVAIVDDLDSNGINEVAVRADRLYLISLKSSTYTIMLDGEAGRNGLSNIEDINGDDCEDIIAGTGTMVTALMGALPEVTAPVFSPPQGTYSGPQNVSLSCATSGATIRYTSDGSSPTSTSTVYLGPIRVNTTTTLKARAFMGGMTDSDVASATYAISQLKVSTLTISPAGGTYSNIQSVTISCSTSGATIRYTVDGSEPSPLSSTYSTPILISGGTITFKAKAFRSDMTDSDTASATYTINTPSKVATPTFSPSSGTYSSPQTVILSCSTSGATITYIINGAEPSSLSPVYAGPILVNANSTIRARAFKEGMTNSEVASSTYNIARVKSWTENWLIYALGGGAIAIISVGGALLWAKRRKTIT
jgi:hypothetical protein